eukprot:772353-Amorphochlora_amoeboformis.AAC.1
MDTRFPNLKHQNFSRPIPIPNTSPSPVFLPEEPAADDIFPGRIIDRFDFSSLSVEETFERVTEGCDGSSCDAPPRFFAESLDPPVLFEANTVALSLASALVPASASASSSVSSLLLLEFLELAAALMASVSLLSRSLLASIMVSSCGTRMWIGMNLGIFGQVNSGGYLGLIEVSGDLGK